MAEDVVYAEAADPGLGAAHPAAAQLRVRILVTAMVDSIDRKLFNESSGASMEKILGQQDLADIYSNMHKSI